MTKGRSRSSSANGYDYDVIVIGTGMGGSAAGAISALNGMKTLILEKNPRPGGACSYYEKEGFKIDTGTHLFIRRNSGPFGLCTRRLGMGNAIEFLTTQYTTQFKGANVDVLISRSLVANGLRMILPKLFWQTKISPIHFPAILQLGVDLLFMREHEIEAIDNISVDEFVCRYTKHPDIRMLLGGLLGLYFIIPPWDASAGESIWNMQKMAWQTLLLRAPVGYPKGGCVSIPTTFLKGAENHGATLKVSAGVKKINISQGKVTGVTLEDGSVVTARAVISTSNVSDTVELLSGPEYYPADYVNRVRELKPSWTAVQAKIGLKKKLTKAGSIIGAVPLKIKGGLTEGMVRDYITKLDDGDRPDMMPIYCPIPSNYDPSLAPKGCQLLTVVGCAPLLDVKLKQDPQVWIDQMLSAMNELLPGMNENIIFCDTWSVQTLANWIGKSNASAITTGQTTDQVRFKRPPHETPVRGLYLAGDCAGPARGVGTELACQSGMDCADLVSSHIYNSVL